MVYFMVYFMENPMHNKWMMTGDSPIFGNLHWLVVWLPFFIFPLILGMSSSQLTNSYSSGGWPNHQPVQIAFLGDEHAFTSRILMWTEELHKLSTLIWNPGRHQAFMVIWWDTKKMKFGNWLGVMCIRHINILGDIRRLEIFIYSEVG